jgi:hypothetical protein
MCYKRGSTGRPPRSQTCQSESRRSTSSPRCWCSPLLQSQLACWGKHSTDGDRAGGWIAPRIPWGEPDLQRRWPVTHLMGTPLQRDESLSTKALYTAQEMAARQQQVLACDKRYKEAVSAGGGSTRATKAFARSVTSSTRHAPSAPIMPPIQTSHAHLRHRAEARPPAT